MMPPPGHEYEDVLRRALREAAGRVDPAADGLDRIYSRLSEPWLRRHSWLFRSAWGDLVCRALIRAEPAGQWLRSAPHAVAARARVGAAALERIGVRPALPAPRLGWPRRLLEWQRLPADQPGGPAGRAPRSTLGWLRSAVVVLGAVALVVAGVYGFGQLGRTVIEITQFSTTPAKPAGSAGYGSYQHHRPRRSPPAARLPSPSASVQPQRYRPSASCSPSPRPRPSPTVTPSPSPSGTGSPSPSVGPASPAAGQPTGSLAAARALHRRGRHHRARCG